MSGDPELDVLVTRLASLEKPGREALEVCDEIVGRWGASEDPVNNDAVLIALSEQAHMLRQSGRLEESVGAYDEVLARIEHRGGAPKRLVHALYTKGSNLADLGRDAEGVEVFDALLDAVEESPPRGYVRWVIASRGRRACCLANLGRVEAALSDFDAITARYGGEQDVAARSAVADSLAWKAKVLEDQGRLEEAIGACDEVFALIADAHEPDLRLQVVSTYLWEGTLLQRLDRTAEARDLYARAFDAFSQPERPDIDELVARIRRRLIGLTPPARRIEPDAPVDLHDTSAVVARLEGLTQMCVDGDAVEALREASELVAELEAMGAAEPVVVRALSTRAAALFATGATDEAIALWRRIATAWRHSRQPELRRLVALAQHNAANMLMCSGDGAAGEAAMDELVSEFGAFAADAIQDEAAQRAELLGISLDIEDAASIALASARVLVRCAPGRVAAITDPPLAELRRETRTPMRDELIAQLEQLRADAREI